MFCCNDVSVLIALEAAQECPDGLARSAFSGNLDEFKKYQSDYRKTAIAITEGFGKLVSFGGQFVEFRLPSVKFGDCNHLKKLFNKVDMPGSLMLRYIVRQGSNDLFLCGLGERLAEQHLDFVSSMAVTFPKLRDDCELYFGTIADDLDAITTIMKVKDAMRQGTTDTLQIVISFE